MNIRCLEEPEIESVLAWLFERKWPDFAPADAQTAVLQCTDTFVWGLWNGTEWKPGVDCGELRTPTKATLREARIFGTAGEILLWRHEDEANDFGGRILQADIEPEPETPRFDPTPIERKLYFAGRVPLPQGEKRDSRHDVKAATKTDNGLFIRRRDGSGQITVTPHGEGVLTYDYLQADETGALRVALTRFVSLI